MFKHLLLSLRPTGVILFDEVQPAGKTYTQAEFDAAVKEKADASYKAGLKKAKDDAQTEAEKAELDAFRKAKLDQEAENELNGVIEALGTDDLKEAGLTANGINRFAKEFKDELKGLKGAELATKVKTLRDDKANALYFNKVDVSASGTLIEAAKGGQEKQSKVEYYKGTTIKRK